MSHRDRGYSTRDDGRTNYDRDRSSRESRRDQYRSSQRRSRSRSNSRSRPPRPSRYDHHEVKHEFDDRRRTRPSYEAPSRRDHDSYRTGYSNAAPEPPVQKELPNFEVSGVLAEDQNQLNGVALIFSLSIDAEPPESDKCDWRLFEFAGDATARTIKLTGFSCFLFGSETRLGERPSENICFVPLTHESCSKQHAVIQFRRRGEAIKPYVMDLDSTNKTLLNGDVLEPGRYVELRHQDILTFGRCHSDFVLMDALAS